MVDYFEIITLEQVRSALALSNFDHEAAHARMSPMPRPIVRDPDLPGEPKQAAVLILLYLHQGQLYFPLIRRAEYPGVHSGQISFPGGRREVGETVENCATRETQEEIGVPCEDIRIIGQLTTIYVPPSDYLISPIVGSLAERPNWRPDPTEVAEIIEVPLAMLFDDTLKASRDVERYGRPFHIRYYGLNGHEVWGATAILLSELEHRLRALF